MGKSRISSVCARLLPAAFFLCFLTPPAGARQYYSWEKRPEKTFFIKTKIRRWQTATSAQSRSAMLTPASWWTPPSETVSMGNTDDFKSMDAALYLFSAEVQPARGLSFEFETGDNGFSGGKYFGHDWLHAANQTLDLANGVTWENPQHRDYAAKRTETGGTARQYSGAAYLNIYKADGLAQDGEYELAHSLDFFLGYSWYEAKARLFNGNQILSTDFFLPVPPAGPIAGLNSRARMAWYGWRGGFREKANLGSNFFAEGKLAFGPAMKYRGQAYFNLDPGLKNPGLRDSATGQLLEFSISASYRFWKQFEAECGWMAWAYTASSGKETYYYTDGSTWEGKLDRVKAARKGVFFGLIWKY